MRQALKPILFDDQDRAEADTVRTSIVAKAQRSTAAPAQGPDQAHRSWITGPQRSLRLGDLATVTHNTMAIAPAVASGPSSRPLRLHMPYTTITIDISVTPYKIARKPFSRPARYCAALPRLWCRRTRRAGNLRRPQIDAAFKAAQNALVPGELVTASKVQATTNLLYGYNKRVPRLGQRSATLWMPDSRQTLRSQASARSISAAACWTKAYRRSQIGP
jgi:hypothetical protein